MLRLYIFSNGIFQNKIISTESTGEIIEIIFGVDLYVIIPVLVQN